MDFNFAWFPITTVISKVWSNSFMNYAPQWMKNGNPNKLKSIYYFWTIFMHTLPLIFLMELLWIIMSLRKLWMTMERVKIQLGFNYTNAKLTIYAKKQVDMTLSLKRKKIKRKMSLSRSPKGVKDNRSQDKNK